MCIFLFECIQLNPLCLGRMTQILQARQLWLPFESSLGMEILQPSLVSCSSV